MTDEQIAKLQELRDKSYELKENLTSYNGCINRLRSAQERYNKVVKNIEISRVLFPRFEAFNKALTAVETAQQEVLDSIKDLGLQSQVRPLKEFKIVDGVVHQPNVLRKV